METLKDLKLEKECMERIIMINYQWIKEHNFTHPDFFKMKEYRITLIMDLGRILTDINQLATRGAIGVI